MAVLRCSEFMKDPRRDRARGLPAVFLVHGQDLLVERACDKLLECLLGGLDRQIHCHTFAGFVEETGRVLEAINTYGLMASTKVVLIRDSQIVCRDKNRSKLVRKVASLHEQGRKTAAARCFADLCSLEGIDPRKLDTAGDLPECLAQIPAATRRELADLCRQKDLKGGSVRKWAERLAQSIEKGFPGGHYLVLTTGAVDKRLGLYKVIAERGLVIDCAVADGSRKSDVQAQQKVMRETMEQVLVRAGKKAATGVFELLWQRCGFGLRQFVSDLEKVIDYCGSNPEIRVSDVDQVVGRSKIDPIFELTNAVADRNTSRALFYLQSLYAEGIHYLQLLAALINLVRKLLVAREFIDSLPAGTWSPSMGFGQFEHSVKDFIKDFDSALKTRADYNTIKDLLLVRKPGSLYPVYMTLKKADGFSKSELVAALVTLKRADLQLKRSSYYPALILENVIIGICKRQGRQS